MFKARWLLALPLLLASSITTASAQAASIRDRAGMFSPEAVGQAEVKLNRLERESKVPVVIETVESLPGTEGMKPAEKRTLINTVAKTRAQSGDQGVYLLISKNDHLISNVLVRERLASRLPSNVRLGIRDAFTSDFREGNFDAGLNHAVDALGRALAGGPVAGLGGRAGGGGVRPQGGTSGVGTLLMLGLGVLAVMFVLRLIGGLFGGARQGYGGPGQMGGPGGGQGFGGQGYGPGYAPQARGGFMSSLFGGIGGAMAGNWLYDQFSGRHHGSSHDNSSYGSGGYDAGGDGFVGGNDDGGQGGDWGGGGGDWGGGGGDWGGGDGGGGGDW